MNDFLQQIRSGAFSSTRDKRFSGNQNRNRSYSGNSHGNDKRYKSKNADTGIKDETIKTIGDTLQTIAAAQKTSLKIHLRRAVAEERRAHAIENIARCIGKYTGVEINEFVPVEADLDEFIEENAVKADVQATAKKSNVPENSDVNPTESKEDIKLSQEKNVSSVKTDDIPLPETKKKAESMNKEEIMCLIQSLREEGSTYNEIAAHLSELDLPTFSGRGKWHAQTIHRLCQ